MTVPDAWDECVACGHDRDDHSQTGCTGVVVHVNDGPTRRDRDCRCTGFLEERLP